MTSQTESLIVVVTWGILLMLYVLNRYLIKDSIMRRSPKVFLSSESNQANKPGLLLSQTGVLFVFAVNITTFVIIFATALAPSVGQNLAMIKVKLRLI